MAIVLGGGLVKRKLNLGCGRDVRAGFVNLDRCGLRGVDVVHDLEERLPFRDCQFDEVHAIQVLEHVINLVPLMNEIYRVLRVGGHLKAAVPWWAGEWARGDPTHVRTFDHNSFNVYCEWWPRYAYLGILGPWVKISQTYEENADFGSDGWLERAGFSRILGMTVVLRKGEMGWPQMVKGVL